MCNPGVSTDTAGTAYFYYRPPGQRKQIPATDDSSQKRRVRNTLTCMPGVNSWGPSRPTAPTTCGACWASPSRSSAS